MDRKTLCTLATLITLTLALTATAWAGHDKPRDVRDWLIDRDDIGRGSEPSTSAKTYIRAIGCSDDKAGHIVANNLGGKGDTKNVFPQNETVNSGTFNRWEGEIAATLASKDDRDVDDDDDTAEFLYSHVTVDIRFTFGNSLLPKRPTKVDYCYTPYYTDDMSTALRKDKESRSCKRFDNPMSRVCEKEQKALDKWDDLVEQATKHMKAQKHLRDPDKFLTKKSFKAVSGADIEKKDDAASRKVEDVIEDQQDRIDDQWDDARDEYDELIARFRQYEKIGEREKDATEWLEKLRKDKKEIGKVVKRKTSGNGSTRADKTIEHNKKQHEYMQNSKKKCDEKYDGIPKKPDCIEYETCTVWEFLPDSSSDKSRKRATAIKYANQLKLDKLKGDKRKATACFDEDGKSLFEGKVASYRAFK